MRKPPRILPIVGGVVLVVFGALEMQSLPGQSTKFAYPKADQSQAQQDKDKAECHQWSVQQAGFDPTVPAQQTQQAASQPPPGSSGDAGTLGAAAGGAARGAALGAVGGAIAGDTGKSAAVGAGVGALGGVMRRSSKERERAQWEAQQQQLEQQQMQAAQQRDQGQENYDRAWSACMTARDYQIQ